MFARENFLGTSGGGGGAGGGGDYASLASMVAKRQREASTSLENAVDRVVASCRPAASAAAAARDQMLELELRFGVTEAERTAASSSALLRPGAAFTQTDYENVAQAMFRHGWKSGNKAGDTILRIIPSGVPGAGGGKDSSNDNNNNSSGGKTSLRAEIHGNAAIQAYCRGNSIETVLQTASAVSAAQETVFFTRKQNIGAAVPFQDLEFRVSLARETRIAAQDESDPEVQSARKHWASLDKYFRHMNRVRIQADDGCVALDLSIVHSNRRKESKTAAVGRTPAEVGMFSDQHFSHVEYEVELEIDNGVITRWIRSEEKAARKQQRKKIGSGSGSEETPVVVGGAGGAGGAGGGAREGLSPAETLVARRVLDQIKAAVRIVSGALQSDSKYPVGRLERNSVFAEYMSLMPRTSSQSSFFAGPNSVTLMREHCAQITDDYCVTDKADGQRALLFVSKTTKPGRVYLISNALRVQWTGAQTDDEDCQHLLLDGEFITHGRGGVSLNLFAAFDLYAAHGELRMGLPFADLVYERSGLFAETLRSGTSRGSRGKTIQLPPYRLPQLQFFAAKLDGSLSASSSSSAAAASSVCRMTVRAKEFYLGSSAPDDSSAASIFAQSRAMLTRHDEYETDGLIFTPTDTAVGGTKPVFQRGQAARRVANGDDSDDDDIGGAAQQEVDYTPVALPSGAEVARALQQFQVLRSAWTRSFKWKPAEQNTIDFLVSIHTPETQHLTVGGRTVFYKRLRLFSGYHLAEKAVGTKTDMYHMLMDTTSASASSTPLDRAEEVLNLRSLSGSRGGGDDYRPRAFVPSTPFDLEAQYCCIEVGADGHVRAQNGDLIVNASIVEFGFDRDGADAQSAIGGGASWRWRAHKVRHDKTSKLRAGMSEFGNPYYAANSNWTSIHYPVTRAMIAGEEALPSVDGGVYYEAPEQQAEYTMQLMIRLVDFHNRVVKTRLLERVARAAFGGTGGSSAPPTAQLRNTLIDFAVGKAGDLSKWAKSHAHFVLGLDLSRDNIFNKNDGAIVRAQNRRSAEYPKCIFLPADSSLNIRRTGAAFYQEGEARAIGHRVVSALFGDAPVPPNTLSPRFQRVVAGGEDGQGGFRVACCMFALHYFWRNLADLHAFLRNLAECTALGGLFTGTCFDGAEVFRALRDHAFAGADATTGPTTTGTQLATFYTLESSGENRLAPPRTMFSLAKKYTALTFEAGPQSVGMCVSMYMESIGRAHDEYLVHFPYFDELMRLYGFELLPEADMVAMGFQPTGEGGRRSFKELYDEKRESRGPTADRKAFKMSEEEKKISFWNRLFVYRKKHAVSADALDALHREHVLDAPAANMPIDAREDENEKKNKKKKKRALEDPDPFQLEFTGRYEVMKEARKK